MLVEGSLMAGTYRAAAEATERIRSSRAEFDVALDAELSSLKSSAQMDEIVKDTLPEITSDTVSKRRSSHPSTFTINSAGDSAAAGSSGGDTHTRSSTYHQSAASFQSTDSSTATGASSRSGKPFHFHPSSPSSQGSKEYHPLPSDLFDGRYIMLNIGKLRIFQDSLLFL
jgi:hypothetical protein